MDKSEDKDIAGKQGPDQGQPGNLEALREKALQILVPMVDEIQDAPERRFEILITASRSSGGNEQLLSKALEAAQQIENANDKANAVLDVLNEVNYHLKAS